MLPNKFHPPLTAYHFKVHPDFAYEMDVDDLMQTVPLDYAALGTILFANNIELAGRKERIEKVREILGAVRSHSNRHILFYTRCPDNGKPALAIMDHNRVATVMEEVGLPEYVLNACAEFLSEAIFGDEAPLSHRLEFVEDEVDRRYCIGIERRTGYAVAIPIEKGFRKLLDFIDGNPSFKPDPIGSPPHQV